MARSGITVWRPREREEWPAEVRSALLALAGRFPPPSNRRRSARTPLCVEGRMHLWDSPAPILVYTRDVSPGGIGLIADLPLFPGIDCRITLALGDCAPLCLPGQTQRCAEFAPGWFDVVVQLKHECPRLAADQLPDVFRGTVDGL